MTASSIIVQQAQDEQVLRLEKLAAAMQGEKAIDYFPRCLQEQAAGNRVLFLATLDGQDAGYGMLNWQPQYSLYRRLGIPEIQDLNVIPDMRCKGVASAIIAQCEQTARDRGAEHIGISFGLHGGYGAAQRLYIRLGYMPDGNGVTYDRRPVAAGQMWPVDDDLCLMLVKDITKTS
jgi:GNAT superfamily N-acetyltransferase